MKKGEVMSKKQKQKISKSLIGHPVSEKNKKQCGKIWKGKHPTTEFKKGHPAPKTAFKKGQLSWNKGKKFPEFSRENNKQWKGEDAGYCPKHSWISRHLGKPTKCKSCGKDGLIGRQVHWANKNHKYKRNEKDWIRLCVKCHILFDKKNNLRK